MLKSLTTTIRAVTLPLIQSDRKVRPAPGERVISTNASSLFYTAHGSALMVSWPRLQATQEKNLYRARQLTRWEKRQKNMLSLAENRTRGGRELKIRG